MNTDAAPRPLNWKLLYQQAMLETDPAKLRPLITEANDAILDRIERGDATALPAELPELNDALTALRLLRREYERSLQEYRELRKSKLG
jgi:hypothetical protein